MSNLTCLVGNMETFWLDGPGGTGRAVDSMSEVRTTMWSFGSARKTRDGGKCNFGKDNETEERGKEKREK